MDDTKFWSIIEDCHVAAGGDMDQKDELIKAAASRLSPADAESFGAIFDRLMDTAYSHQLWGAAYIIHGGCGDDSFTDFRASLISRGRAAFEKAMRDPDSFADEDIDDEAWFHEGFEYGVMDGLQAALGREPSRATEAPTEPSGYRWEEAELKELFPKLTQRFG
jgi:Protein of unknown function (DUF4240)